MANTLEENLNIIAEDDTLEIQHLDGDLNIIQKLDDEPNDVGGLTAQELKAKFDEGPNIIKRYINETLIPAILEDDATEAARAQAEEDRAEAETGRAQAELAREAAEAAREDATDGVVAQAGTAAQSWAVGGTGTREGEETDNAKYWAQQARYSAGGGVTSFNGRNGNVTPAAGDYTAVQVGADPAGSAAAVQSSLNAHTARQNNPHQVTAAQIGAATEEAVQEIADEMAGLYTYGTEDLTAGTSPLTTGKLYFVYE